MESKSCGYLLCDHISPKTCELGVTLEIARSKYAAYVIHRYGVVPVVIIHVSDAQKRGLVAVGARTVVVKTETIFRENSLELEAT